MSRSRSFLKTPLRSCSMLARLWVLACLLPMLFSGVAGNVPHEHELHLLSAVVHQGQTSSENVMSARGVAQHARAQSAIAHKGASLAPHVLLEHWTGELCLLCQWASAMGALLCVALAISWLLVSTLSWSSSVSFTRICPALALRSRAPPV